MQAFVFPGQGSQISGMGRDVATAFPEAQNVFDAADRALDLPLSQLCFEGSAEQLRLTENTQPALLTTSIALFEVLKRRGHTPDYVAGHSLGEYSALVAAESLDFEDAVRLVRQRGLFMQESVPVGQGAMAAVVGMKIEEVQDICNQAAGEELVKPANINSPGQIVVAGHRKAVERVLELIKEIKGVRAVLLPVSAPFHCDLMDPAGKRLAQVMREVSFHDLKIPLVNNVDAAVVYEARKAREGLIRQVVNAVRWSDCVRILVRKGVNKFVEVGPGRVLSILIRRTVPKVQTVKVGNLKQLKHFLESG